MTLRCRIGTLLLLLLFPTGPGGAVELNGLVEILRPAFVARDVATLCSLYDRNFVTETSGQRGDIDNYVPHIEREVLSALREEDADRVVREAASAARNSERSQLEPILSSGSKDSDTALATWCRRDGKSLVRDVMQEHDRDHSAFLRTVEQIKGQAGAVKAIKTVGPGNTGCRQYLLDLAKNPQNQRVYFAWVQGLMSGVLIRAPPGIDENVDLLPAEFAETQQVRLIGEFCNSQPDADLFDATRLLYRRLKDMSAKRN